VGDLDVVDGARRTVTCIALDEGCLLVQVAVHVCVRVYLCVFCIALDKGCPLVQEAVCVRVCVFECMCVRVFVCHPH